VLHQAPRPAGAEAAWRAFQELDATRRYSDMGGAQAIQHQDVEAWCRTMRFPLHPDEILAVLALDHERRAFDAAQRGKQPDDEDDE